MKTTLDLPDDLLQRLKIRAVRERRPLKRLVAELLAQALERPLAPPPESGALPDGIELNEKGCPVIRCGPNANAHRMSVREIVELEHRSLAEDEIRHAGLSF